MISKEEAITMDQGIKMHIGNPSISTILKYFKTTKISEAWKEIEDNID